MNFGYQYLNNFARMSFNELSRWQKKEESREVGKTIMPGVPVIMRLDGKAFHTFTRGLQRPYDTRLQTCMAETLRSLIETFEADLGYTQSDEITLVWWNSDLYYQFPYSGKTQKLLSVIAGHASTTFTKLANKHLPEKNAKHAVFDARIWQVPTLVQVLANLMWRRDDAVRNSYSMALQAHYTHKELHGVGGNDKELLLANKGVSWKDDYNEHFRQGIYAARFTFDQKVNLSAAVLAKIPVANRPAETVRRTGVKLFSLTPIRKIGKFNLTYWITAGCWHVDELPRFMKIIE